LKKIIRELLLLVLLITSIISFSEDFFLMYPSEYDQSKNTVKINLESLIELQSIPDVYIYDGGIRKKLITSQVRENVYSFYVNLNSYTGDVYSFLVSSTDKDGQYISHFFNNFLAKEDFVPEIKVEITTSIGPNGYEYYLDFYPNNTLYLIDIIIDGKEFDSKEDFLNALKNLKEGLYRTQFIFRNRYGIYFKVDSTFLKLNEVVITENILKPQQKFEIIGYHIVQKGESLYKIAREYNVLPGDLVNINNLRDPSLIYPGQALKIGKVEYYESPIHLEIDLSKNKMYLYFHEQLLKTYVVAVGMSDYTPPGYYRISYKEKDPALYWYDEYIPPGSLLNGMGTRWLQLSNPQYGIHGTTKPWEIGKRISHGCIRMFNFDVEEIDFITSLGTEVYVYNSKN